MKSAAVAAGDTATAAQYNNLRQDAQGSATLFAGQQSTPNMTLLIQAGSIFFGTTKVDYAGGNTGSFTAPVGNPRIDLVYITSGGTITILQGTAAASPVPPTTPANVVPICHVYLRVSTTALYDTDQGTNGYVLRDIRPFLIAPLDAGVNRQVFIATGAGTWTKPANGTIARVRAWGGGGSGARGAASTRAGGGGGGGGCTEKWFLLTDLAATESVSVGAGGAAVSGGSTMGNNGANTTFGSGGTLVTGYAGGGGNMTAANAGYGGGGGGGTQGAGANATTTTAGNNGGIPRSYIFSTNQFGSGGAVNVNGSTGDQAGGGGGGGGGGSTASAVHNGGSATYGGGGGGGGIDGSGASGYCDGGSSLFGGGGGGGCGYTTAGQGGKSLMGGNGGAGNNGANAATAGSQPAGGGGGSENANSGAGGAGMVEVVVF